MPGKAKFRNAGKARRPDVKDLQALAATAVKAKMAGPLLLMGNPASIEYDSDRGWVVMQDGKVIKEFGSGHAGRAAAGKYAAKLKMAEKKNPTRRNHHNEAAAFESYREFHGREPAELIEGETKYHYPGRTAAIGELISLKIRVPAGRVEGARVVTVKNFDGAMLTRHPTEIQLYVELGDQSLDLEEFGITDPHAVEYLGHLVEVTYYTVKDHLGREGGEANYVHKFGTNEATGEKTECPRVNYRVDDEQIEFSGGGYTIPSEGIDG